MTLPEGVIHAWIYYEFQWHHKNVTYWERHAEESILPIGSVPGRHTNILGQQELSSLHIPLWK